MEKITSFTINHLSLQPGVYVSRKDPVGGAIVTTFDLRMTSPNEEPVMNTAEVHAIEHLGATFLRNHKKFAPKILYFGPMGCRTGFYLLLSGGISYTAGLIFYAMKNTKYMHGVWHLFVLAGSVLHYLCIAIYILPMAYA